MRPEGTASSMVDWCSVVPKWVVDEEACASGETQVVLRSLERLGTDSLQNRLK